MAPFFQRLTANPFTTVIGILGMLLALFVAYNHSGEPEVIMAATALLVTSSGIALGKDEWVREALGVFKPRGLQALALLFITLVMVSCTSSKPAAGSSTTTDTVSSRVANTAITRIEDVTVRLPGARTWFTVNCDSLENFYRSELNSGSIQLIAYRDAYNRLQVECSQRPRDTTLKGARVSSEVSRDSTSARSRTVLVRTPYPVTTYKTNWRTVFTVGIGAFVGGTAVGLLLRPAIRWLSLSVPWLGFLLRLFR